MPKQMFLTRVLRQASSFRLGVAKTFSFELVPSNNGNTATTQNQNNNNAMIAQTATDPHPIVLSASSFASAETLNAALDKHIQEGQTTEIWVPASVLNPPSQTTEKGPIPLLLGATPTDNLPIARPPSSSLVEWKTHDVQSVKAHELSPSALGGTHLPSELVSKMSPSSLSMSTTSNKTTPASQRLIQASTNADQPLLRAALEEADPNDESAQHGASPLHLLASTHADCQDAILCIRILLDKGACINQRASNGSTPLHWACGNGNYEIAQELLLQGADPSVMTFTWFRDVFGKHSGQTPLHWASESGYNDCVDLLLDHAPWIVGSVDERGATPSSLALLGLNFDTADNLKRREDETFVLLRAKLEGVVAVPIV